jgi:hypothetical protein
VKVGIIGAGAVGSACLTALVVPGWAPDRSGEPRSEKGRRSGNRRLIRRELSHAARRTGDYSGLEGAAMVMITAGANEETGGVTDRNDPAGRLRPLDTNVAVYKSIVPQLHTVCDPCERSAGGGQLASGMVIGFHFWRYYASRDALIRQAGPTPCASVDLLFFTRLHSARRSSELNTLVKPRIDVTGGFAPHA